MRFGFIFLFLFAAFQAFSQEDTVRRRSGFTCKILKHELEVDPISIWMNKRPSIGHRLKYTYIGFPWQLSVETNGTLFNALDANSKGGKLNGIFPLLNRSQLFVEHGMSFYAPRWARDKNYLGRLFLRAGYHYFQHATGANRDYWSIDSSAQTGLRTIAGFRSHSALIGVTYGVSRIIFKHKKVGRVRHLFSLDYMYSPHYSIKLYDSQSETDFNTETVKSFLPVTRSGAQFGYHFRRKFGLKFGYHVDVEALWVPFLKDYEPNYDFFVPRGGERITPIFLNARVGMYWMF